MSQWDEGYVTDIDYTYGYYAELNPLRIKLAFLNAGLAVPEVGTACELGFGQGLSTNIHAAGSMVQWHGTDFNPSQAAFARELAKASGAGIALFDEAFAEFASRAELPEFDFIALHGIFSWISPDNQAIIVDFIRRKLKIGGVLYISYNTLPGWAPFAPIRNLMAAHSEVYGVPGSGVIKRLEASLDFTEKLFEVEPAFAKVNPQLKPRLEKLKKQNKHYLAHEYFNGHWVPMHFSDMAAKLGPAKVQFGCTAHFLDHVDPLNLLPAQIKFLNDISDTVFRETVRDYVINQQFRRDYWVKGPRRLTPLEQIDQLRQLRMVLAVNPSQVSLKVRGMLGEATMSEAIYRPIIAAFEDHRVKTLGQVEKTIGPAALTFNQLIQAALVLAGQGVLIPAHDESTISRARKQTDRINSHIISLARTRGDVGFLASPVTGGGVSVARTHLLFLLAISKGQKSPADWATFAWEILSAQGHKLVKEERTLETAEENALELSSQANDFNTVQLPVLKALGIA